VGAKDAYGTIQIDSAYRPGVVDIVRFDVHELGAWPELLDALVHGIKVDALEQGDGIDRRRTGRLEDERHDRLHEGVEVAQVKKQAQVRRTHSVEQPQHPRRVAAGAAVVFDQQPTAVAGRELAQLDQRRDEVRGRLVAVMGAEW
jgi:hypothetical protein